MCQKHSTVMFLDFRIDPCLFDKLADLYNMGYTTRACCCGHGKYPETIVIETKDGIYELNSGIYIPRKRRFYVKDSQGIYYIPEIQSRLASNRVDSDRADRARSVPEVTPSRGEMNENG